MNHTVTGTCHSSDQLRVVMDELVSVGIPSEKIYVDESAKTIKVLMPTDTQPNITEIFRRHGLSTAAH